MAAASQTPRPVASPTAAAMVAMAGVAAAFWLVGGCDGGRSAAPASAPTAFTDVTALAGVGFHYENGARAERFIMETMIGGAGWIDYDGDGHLDIYLVNAHSEPSQAGRIGAPQHTNRLFRNTGDGRFADVTAAAGVGDRRYGMGLAVGDYDNDGDEDLCVTNFGRNTLYQNRGDGTFADVTAAAGLTAVGFNTSAAWFDLEGDGDLDLYIVRYVNHRAALTRRCAERGEPVYCHPRLFHGEPDLLYRNRGDGTFEDISRAAGIARAGPHSGKGLGVIPVDYDVDGDTDIYVANDTTPNFLWRNNGDGTLTEVAHASGVSLSAAGRPQAGMGVDIGDADGNGFLDIYVTNFSRDTNSLYLASDARSFVESCRAAGLGGTFVRLGFGTLFADLDLDGDVDLVTVNGHVNDRVEATDPRSGLTYKQPPDLFWNDGSGRFTPAAPGTLPVPDLVGRALARCDYDNDGDLDLLLTAIDSGVVLLANESTAAARSVTLRLLTARARRAAYGARVRIEIGTERQTFEVQSAGSYLAASDPRLVIGLGEAEKIDRVLIRWPSGRREVRRDIAAGTRLEIVEGE